LVYGFFFFQDFQRYLRFLTGCKVLSFGHSGFSLPPYFFPFSCPIFLIHYTGHKNEKIRESYLLNPQG
jgi:hypothetical protein